MQDAERKHSRSRWLVTETEKVEEDKHLNFTPKVQRSCGSVRKMMTECVLSCVALGGPLWEEAEAVILSGIAELKNIGRCG